MLKWPFTGEIQVELLRRNYSETACSTLPNLIAVPFTIIVITQRNLTAFCSFSQSQLHRIIHSPLFQLLDGFKNKDSPEIPYKIRNLKISEHSLRLLFLFFGKSWICFGKVALRFTCVESSRIKTVMWFLIGNAVS